MFRSNFLALLTGFLCCYAGNASSHNIVNYTHSNYAVVNAEHNQSHIIYHSTKYQWQSSSYKQECIPPTYPISVCFNGSCPIGASTDNYLVNHEIFVLSSNRHTKFADWIAYRVEKDNINGENNSRHWRKDPCIPEEYTLSPKDYSKASATCGYDRGHQAPLADFTNSPLAENANFLSNITPQQAQLNQRGWERLETAERKLTDSYNTIYVLTGPYYIKGESLCQLPARKDVVIPSGYWKVIVAGDKATHKYAYAAFIFKQSDADKNYCANRLANLDKIESLTKLNLFPDYNSFDSNSELIAKLKC